MPLTGAKELLAAAERGSYAVPGFNVSNVEMLLGVLDAAEARRAGIFVQFNLPVTLSALESSLQMTQNSAPIKAQISPTLTDRGGDRARTS